MYSTWIVSSVTRLGDLLDLGNFLRPLATINLPKSLTFLWNFCKAVKIYHFSSEIILGQVFIDIWRLFSGHTDCQSRRQPPPPRSSRNRLILIRNADTSETAGDVGVTQNDHDVRNDVSSKHHRRHRHRSNVGSVKRCDVVGCDVVGCDVVGCDVVGCDVVGCDVVGYDVVGCDVVGCDVVVGCDKALSKTLTLETEPKQFVKNC